MARGHFGERLKRERELREVSLNEVTVATRISTRFLQAMENEDWDKLPGGAFNRGFVRSVARYLGLDEENLLAEYDMARGGQSVEIPRPLESHSPPGSQGLHPAVLLAALLALAAIITAGFYGWHRYSAHRKGKQSSAVFLYFNSALMPMPIARSRPLEKRGLPAPSRIVQPARPCCCTCTGHAILDSIPSRGPLQ